MASEWWITPNKINMLSGLDTWNSETLSWDNDAENPARLHRYHIIEFLKQHPEARNSFNRLYPNMTEEEKLRLDDIAKAAKHMTRSPKEVEDTFQRRQNTVGIYTTGKRGGGN